MLSTFWKAEPVMLSLLGSAAVWVAVFAVLAAFGHPLAPNQQTALLALLAAVGGLIGRSQVSPTDKAQSVDVAKLGQL